MSASAEEDGGCDWFEWAEMDDEGENIHPLRNTKRSADDAPEKEKHHNSPDHKTEV